MDSIQHGSSGNEPIAVIGSACRFSGSLDTPSKLWEVLKEPKDLLTKIPRDRFNADAFYHPNGLHHGTSNVTESYMLAEDPRHFDAAFFNIKPIEAHSVDPQQRLLMEVVYESLEAAGLPFESLVGSQTGVYVGLMCADFANHLQRDVDATPTYMGTGTARSIISNRISYFFDWHGPSMTIDTACSSSLVAVHQAVQLLRSGESDLAVAAGANLILGPEQYIGESKLKMLSPGSRSRMWDANADGYARGEGIASVILKRLSDAIRDGDHVECIVRESGVNSDGRTKGITMPNPLAQAELITRTYRKTGLDPEDPGQRCQYFEAHGTGTTAGDACEAEGIKRAFFGLDATSSSPHTPLYVGSIKTVLGHTEGTAGLAGLFKVSLALQNGTIPPNMLFENLSPDVAPFYSNLEVATRAKPWPKTSGPRRASVNSFGFGGTNSHAILESFDNELVRISHGSNSRVFTPYVFSAGSEAALTKMLKAYLAHLKANPSVSHRDLSYTLHSRRSSLGVRASFPSSAYDRLASNIDNYIQGNEGVGATGIGVRPAPSQPRVLGVFTGQGAQWATMGREIILGSEKLRESWDGFQHVLNSLPKDHQPTWSLVEELAADATRSRIGEAVISQTLCTAVQITLVDILRASGVEFQAVVGHSSGEIAAAYAAGFISREDALKIAYHRGLCVSSSTCHKKGAMLAVGTTVEDAVEVCNLGKYKDRVCLAACNSPLSVTLSGDEDAIEEAKVLFEDENKFSRRLNVDQAYHSHHMIPKSAGYAEALRACGIQPRQGRKGCRWYSSVSKNTVITASDALGGEYWKENMLQPVLFYQAIQTALKNEDALNLVVEVGPHPALKGPVLETWRSSHDKAPAYTGVLQRNIDDIEALSAAHGYMWSHFSTPFINFNAVDVLLSGNDGWNLVPSLPTYPWDHDRIFWHETRLLRAYNDRNDSPHSLLGARLPDGLDDEIRWRNLIRPSELAWIHGHQVQGQMVYPAAAYISSAIESARFLGAGQEISVIDIHDFVIRKALVFQDESSEAESLFALSDIDRKIPDQISATFKFHASTSSKSDILACLATGRLVVSIGISRSVDEFEHQQRNTKPPYLLDVTQDNFYSSLENLGYHYTRQFRALQSMKRKLGYGEAIARVPSQEIADSVLVHPALLDAAIQSILLAYWWPGDGSLDQLHVPTKISSIRVNAQRCQLNLVPGNEIPIESRLTQNPLITGGIEGDADVFGPSPQSGLLLQVQGIKVTPLSERSPEKDRRLFCKHIWAPALPDGSLAANNRASAEDVQLAADLERISLYYMNQVSRDTPEDKRDTLSWHHKAMFDCFSHVIRQSRIGRQRFTEREWLNDTWEDIEQIMDRYPDSIEIKLTRTVGEHLTAAVRGETEILQHMLEDDLLNRYYVEAMGLKDATSFLSRVISQIAHRYPHMDILEIGAGTGGATKTIKRDIGRSFASYTFTDVSSGFFEKAREVFAAQYESEKMTFNVLDGEKDVVEQGYEEYSYDLVIASLVLHATRDLQKTLTNTRRLLRPGGYLVILELTSNDVVWVGFAMSGLPGWWLGQDDDRKFSPCVSSLGWYSIMMETGFSGIDTSTPEVDTLARPFSVLVTQAIDERTKAIRDPLLHYRSFLREKSKQDLVIIGGATLTTKVLVDSILQLIRPLEFSIIHCASLEDVAVSAIPATALVLCVTELDSPIFCQFSSESMSGLQSLFDYQRTILWVTQGCQADQPYMNMSVGLGRSLALEFPDVRLQFLDIDNSRKPDARLVAETLLRLNFTDTEGILWSVEQEMVQENDRVMIPRLVADRDANRRYNAANRTITEDIDPGSTSLRLHRSSAGYSIYDSNINISSDEVMIHVRKATLLPILGNLHGIFGKNERTGNSVMCFSAVNGSIVAVQAENMVELSVTAGDEARLLALLRLEVQVSQVLDVLEPGSTVVINEPIPILAQRLHERAFEKGVHVFFTESAALSGTAALPQLRVNNASPKRLTKSALPTNISVFIDCFSEPGGVARFVEPCLPDHCWRTSLSAIQHMYSGTKTPGNDSLSGLLRRVISHYSPLTPITFTIANPRDVVAMGGSYEAGTIVDWKGTALVPVRLTSVNGQIQFDENKTYVLFGLTSDLATSLCDWMSSRGARTIVLTSRDPNIDERWLEEISRAGVHVRVFSNDITDQTAVEKLVATIRREFPPIGGIMNGAMVLQDVPFSEMSFEIMEKVLRPKVLGTMHLDRLFRDDSLDFFVMFSSIAAAAGNRGQSNYSAANMFMVATAMERRRQGLAASVLHLGAVLGVGYIMREFDETVLPTIHRGGFMWMEERGFHQCIAEAILAGRPQAGRSPEIITGLRMTNADDAEPVPWIRNPRFQHYINWGGDGNLKKTMQNAAVPVRARLFEARNLEEMSQIIQDGFVGKLQAALQLQLDDNSEQFNMSNMNADDLGIDSLVAVEIRSWFLREMDVDMPVLKILGGASLADLITFALENIPSELTPKLVTVETQPMASNESELQKTQLTPLVASSGSNGSVLASIDNLSRSAESTIASSSSESPLPESESEPGDAGLKSRSFEHKPVLAHEIERSVPMSAGQSRFWFLKHFVQDQTTFNITFSIKINGELNEHKFEAAVKVLGHRHEALRTAFITEGDQNLQCVLKNSLLCLEKRAIRDISQVSREFEDLRDYIYDIEHGETMRMLLLSLSSEQSFLIIGYHHINMDGASLEVFLADLEKAYTGKPLAPNPLQYPDFSLRQSLERKEGKHRRELDFWKAKLDGCPTPLPILPWSLTKSREPIRRYEHTKVTRYIEADLSSRINYMCRKQRASIFHFYLAVFEVMLYRLLHAPDLCIGMADANRFEGNLSGSIGMYLNLIPLVAHLKPSQSFRDVLRETRRNAYEAMAHSKLPFDALLDDLKVDRSIFHSPLFQAFINYRAGVAEKRNFGGLAAEAGETAAGRTAYDICLDIYDNPGASTRIDIVVQKQLYSVEDATILTDSYFHLMNYFSANPDASLSEPTVGFDESTYNDGLLGIGPVCESQWPETLVHRIDDMTENYPTSVALKHGNDVWNYRQMSVRVNSIASALINLELSPKSIVGVFQEAGPDWICSMLAIMRVGATYIPLDTSTPVPRLASMVNDCEPVAVIVDEATFPQTTGLNLRQEALIISTADISPSGGNKVPVKAKSEDAAVILYTSGTTGTPKGVVLSHNGLRNYLEWENMSGQEIVLQHSALGFDLGLWQSLVTLVYGGSVVIVPRPLRGDSVAITKLIAQEKITYVGATPSEYLGWIQYGFSNLSQSTSWKYAMSCGEPCPSKLIEDFGKLRLPDLHLWNSYGPSEATMGSNAKEIPLGEGVADRILAGPALVNRAVHIFDEDLQPLPRGATGEICISGAGVAIGYINNDLLTRQAFVTNPVPPAVFEKNGWTRMYRTGDKGRIMERGSLEVLGRVNGDSQVKIRGVRIELQDIENTIVRVSNGALANAAVTPRGDAPILVAHAVFAKGAEVEDQTQFLQRLAASLPLPRYMHPAIIIPVKELPLTGNGKLDRTAIEKLQVSNGTERATGAAKLGNVERQLREAWEEVISEEVLQHYTIDRGSDFFHVGGNSLLLIKLQHLIKTRFGIALPVATLFEQSTLRAMAAVVTDATYLEATETDWTEETALTKHVVDAGPFVPSATKSTRGVVIMTGATGFLGLELLKELVESPSVTKVHCIAVRSQAKLGSFLGSPKVTLHQGDLSAPRAGLSVQDAEAIFGEADAIVHSGADVSFLKTYQTLRPANVEATKELARLALVHNVPFHYISTTATGRLNNTDTLYEVSLAEYMPPPGYSDGYVAGKWASEVFLEKVHQGLGLPVCIHRPSSITGPAASDLDVMNSVVKFSRQLKAVPTSSRWRGSLDFISVENAAKGIARVVTGSDQETKLKYLHHSGDVIIPIDQLRQQMQEEDGIEYRELSLSDWTELAVGLEMNVLIAAYLAAIDEMDLDVVFQKLIKREIGQG